jgi:hypothetical protein
MDGHRLTIGKFADLGGKVRLAFPPEWQDVTAYHAGTVISIVRGEAAKFAESGISRVSDTTPHRPGSIGPSMAFSCETPHSQEITQDRNGVPK